MKVRQILPALLLFIPLSSSQAEVSETCHEAIRAHLHDPKNPHAIPREVVKEFFRLQAALTLHRLAHAHLKAVAGMAGAGSAAAKAKLPPIQSTILSTIGAIDSKAVKSAEFRALQKRFREAPLSRRTVHDVLEPLETALKTQSKGTPSFFDLHYEDIKMLGILGETEEDHNAQSSLFLDSRERPEGVLNLLKIVNSAYQDRTVADAKGELEIVQEQIGKIVRRLQKYSDRILAILKKVQQNIPACRASVDCKDCGESLQVSRSDPALFIGLLSRSLAEQDYQGVRYGDVWLRTGKAAPPLPGTPSGVGPAPERPVRPQVPRLQLDENGMGAVREKHQRHHESPVHGNAISAHLKRIDRLAGCLESNYPDLITSAHVRAAAVLVADLENGIMRSATQNFFGFFKAAPRFPENPYETGAKTCPALQGMEAKDRQSAIQILGALAFWSSKDPDNQQLTSCSHLGAQDLVTEEKLLFRALFQVGTLSPGDFRNCKVPESAENGTEVYRRFFRAIR